MKRTIFIFGRTPDLSFLELQSFIPEARLVYPGVAEAATDQNPVDLIRVLGGTVKIVEVSGEVPGISEESLLPYLMKAAAAPRITFGISAYGGAHIPQSLPAQLKKNLTERGLSARYVETKHDEALSSVVIAKQQVVDLVVVGVGEKITVGVTRAVQDFEDWNLRDFGRPEPDPKAGMLPPKVARMIVNIALNGVNFEHTPMVLDPFCGVGTILQEALLRGANVTGSDISETAVAHAKKNMEWLRKTYPQAKPLYSNISVADATHLSDGRPNESVDAIVTEPFMGETVGTKDVEKLTPERVKNILKGLEKLYIGSLREWVGVVKPGARIVMAMPAYVTPRGIARVKKVVDRCESLGYTLLTGPIEYSRPQAIVRREFFVFQKK